jgi:hypothetical protein
MIEVDWLAAGVLFIPSSVGLVTDQGVPAYDLQVPLVNRKQGPWAKRNKRSLTKYTLIA